MRCLFNTAAKDVRRFRLYEKSLDALATSPYARMVDRWLLAGGPHGYPQDLCIHPQLVASPRLVTRAGVLWWVVRQVKRLQNTCRCRLGERGKSGSSCGWPMSGACSRLLPAVISLAGESEFPDAYFP